MTFRFILIFTEEFQFFVPFCSSWTLPLTLDLFAIAKFLLLRLSNQSKLMYCTVLQRTHARHVLTHCPPRVHNFQFSSVHTGRCTELSHNDAGQWRATQLPLCSTERLNGDINSVPEQTGLELTVQRRRYDYSAQCIERQATAESANKYSKHAVGCRPVDECRGWRGHWLQSAGLLRPLSVCLSDRQLHRLMTRS